MENIRERGCAFFKKNLSRILEYIAYQTNPVGNSPAVLIEPNIIDVKTLDFTDAKRIITEGNVACDQACRQLIRRVRAWV